MEKIKWDEDGKRFYETGVKNGVLYTRDSSGAYPNGVAWNGLTAVTESPEGAESNPLYADDMKYLNLISAEDLNGTIEAYTYPDEFAECDGSASLANGIIIGQQARKTFGLCYKTTVGNDVDGNDKGFKLHLVYGCLASPSEKAYETINESPSAITFSWEFSTTPVNVSGHKPTALLTVDSTKATASKIAILEAVLYGADEFSATKAYAKDEVVYHTDALYQANAAVEAGAWNDSDWTELEDIEAGPRLPLPDEIVSIFG